MDEDNMVDKVAYKRARRMQGQGPHKMFKMAIKEYQKKKKDLRLDVFDMNRISWRGLEDETD